MSADQKIDLQLDVALVTRLLLAVFGFTTFASAEMIVPGFIALAAVGVVLFHMLVGKYVVHHHIYIAAMSTWGSAIIACVTYDAGLTCVSMFLCLYIYELFVFKKWGLIHA